MMGNSSSVRDGRDKVSETNEVVEEKRQSTVTNWTIQTVGTSDFASEMMNAVDVRSRAVTPGQVVDMVWSQAGGGDKVCLGVQIDIKSQRMLVRCCNDQ